MSRGEYIHLTRDQVVERARSMVRLPGKYKLGLGGNNPHSPNPFMLGSCDCSGFVSWCLGFDRYQPTRLAKQGQYISTTLLVQDAHGRQDLFVWTDTPLPGDIIVYPSQYYKGKRKSIGHCGIFVGGITEYNVIDCNSSKGRQFTFDSPIGLTSSLNFMRKPEWAIVRPKWWNED